MDLESAKELIDKGIEAAKVGNRLLARMHLEKASEANAGRADLWLWLAWAAESPAKAQVYLKKLEEFPSHNSVALGGLQWMDALLSGKGVGSTVVNSVINNSDEGQTTSVNLTAVAMNEAVTGNSKLQMSKGDLKIGCPGCSAVLVIRESAIGASRTCPACDVQFQIDQNTEGAVSCRIKNSVDATSSSRGSTLSKNHTSSRGSASFRTVKTVGKGESTSNQEQPPTILVVDDNATIRRVASLVLTKQGYRVLLATNGEEGLKFALSEKPQLILLDVKMPGWDGYETCKRVRADSMIGKTPIVMLSGNDGFFDIVKGYEAGSSTYLTKPCNADEMIATVQKFVPLPVAVPASAAGVSNGTTTKSSSPLAMRR